MDSYAIAQQSTTSSVVSMIVAILGIIAMWKLFTKAGDKGWKAIIPVYNAYTAYKLFWNKKMFWITLVLGVVAVILGSVGMASLGIFVDGGASNGVGAMGVLLTIVFFLMLIALFVLSIMYSHNLSKSFGHGVGFTLGLIVLQPVFIMILAFGSSKYIGNSSSC